MNNNSSSTIDIASGLVVYKMWILSLFSEIWILNFVKLLGFHEFFFSSFILSIKGISRQQAKMFQRILFSEVHSNKLCVTWWGSGEKSMVRYGQWWVCVQITCQIQMGLNSSKMVILRIMNKVSECLKMLTSRWRIILHCVGQILAKLRVGSRSNIWLSRAFIMERRISQMWTLLVTAYCWSNKKRIHDIRNWISRSTKNERGGKVQWESTKINHSNLLLDSDSISTGINGFVAALLWLMFIGLDFVRTFKSTDSVSMWARDNLKVIYE